MEKIAQGDVGDDVGADAKNGVQVDAEIAAEDTRLEPPAPEFVMDMPNISTIDLCVFPAFFRCGQSMTRRTGTS